MFDRVVYDQIVYDGPVPSKESLPVKKTGLFTKRKKAKLRSKKGSENNSDSEDK